MSGRAIQARGMSLIEVLLALVLLAALAAMTIGIFRDADAATRQRGPAIDFDDASRLADSVLAEHYAELRKLAVGQTWSAPADATAAIHIEAVRAFCEQCPEGWGRLRVTAGAVTLTRFHRVKYAEEPAR